MYNHILIVGAAGFIGSNFARYYFEKYPEARITILDKLTYAGNRANIEDLEEAERFNFVQGDIADEIFLEELFSTNKFDCVVNFAAETHVDASILDPKIFVKTNIIGTHNLLFAAKEHGVERYHQVSTDEVYGDLGDGSTNLFTEETPYDPNCPYAATKASADLLVLSYFETYAYNVTVSRCSNNYGPYQYPEKLIPYFYRLASSDKELPVYGDGLNIRDWLYVLDHCEAIDIMLEKAKPGSVYNIGGNNERTNLEITEIILKTLGKSPDLIRFVEDRKAHDRRYAMDASKIKTELGWEPKVKFTEGIQMTLDWYKDNRDWWENLIAKSNRIKD